MKNFLNIILPLLFLTSTFAGFDDPGRKRYYELCEEKFPGSRLNYSESRSESNCQIDCLNKNRTIKLGTVNKQAGDSCDTNDFSSNEICKSDGKCLKINDTLVTKETVDKNCHKIWEIGKDEYYKYYNLTHSFIGYGSPNPNSCEYTCVSSYYNNLTKHFSFPFFEYFKFSNGAHCEFKNETNNYKGTCLNGKCLK